MTQALVDQLDLLIRARTPILWIRSLEEERVEALLAATAQRLGGRTLLRWDFVSGLEGAPNRNGEAARNPMAALDCLASLPLEQGAILLLKDFHRYCEDAGICRRLRNLATSLRQGRHTLVSAPRNGCCPANSRTASICWTCPCRMPRRSVSCCGPSPAPRVKRCRKRCWSH